MTPRELSDVKEAEAKAKREANPEAAVWKQCEHRKPMLLAFFRGHTGGEASATTRGESSESKETGLM